MKRTEQELIAFWRNVDVKEITHPFVGEVVQTPFGDGVVISVASFSDCLSVSNNSGSFVDSVRQTMGIDFPKKYASVTVEIAESGKFKTFDIWRIDYDHFKNPESTDWR